MHAVTLEAQLVEMISRDGFEIPGVYHVKTTDSTSSTHIVNTAFDEEGEPVQVSRSIGGVSASSVEEWVEKKDFEYTRNMGGWLTGIVSGKLSLETRSKVGTSFEYKFELKEGETEATQSGSGSATSEFTDHFEYESNQDSGHYTRSIFSGAGAADQLLRGQAFERGVVDANSKFEVEYTLDVPNDLWKVTSGSGESHSKAAFHDESSGQGSYTHNTVPETLTTGLDWTPPGWAEQADPGYESPYGTLPGTSFTYYAGIVPISATSTQSFQGSVTESRQRDWGHQYDTETSLVDGEWENTGTGHTFLKFNADFTADRTAAHHVTWSGSGSSGVNHVEGDLDFTHVNSVSSSWHKDYDGKQEYTLAENPTTHANFWRKTTLTESYHATATAASDYDFEVSWDYHFTRDTSSNWELFDSVHTGTLEAHRDETFNSHFEYDNKVTTFNSAGNLQSVSGTLTYGKTSSGTLTRSQDNEETSWRIWEDPNSHLGTYKHFTQDATETYAYNGQWSKNLSTNVPTTIVNTGSTTGDHEAHLIYEEYVGNIEYGGYLDYEVPFDHENTYSYANNGAWGPLMGEHGFTPTDLGTLEHSGAVPGNTGWDIGPQVNPTNNIPYEGPDGVAFPPQTPPPAANPPAVHQPPVEVPESHRKGPASTSPYAYRQALGDIPEFQAGLDYNQQKVRGVMNETLPGVIDSLPVVSTAFNLKMAGAGTDLWDREVSFEQRAWAAAMVGLDTMPATLKLSKNLVKVGEIAQTGTSLSRVGQFAKSSTRSGVLTSVKRLFYDNRSFRNISNAYWNSRGGSNGASLHHWLIPQRATWIPQGIRNAGFNLLELPSFRGIFHRKLSLNSWMGFARNWKYPQNLYAAIVENSIRVILPSTAIGTGAFSYNIADQFIDAISGPEEGE